MGTEAAGEQAVAVGDMDDIAGLRAGGAHGARHHGRPGIEVVVGVADNGGLAGGAGGGVDAAYLLAGYGKHAEGIMIAQVGLEREGKLRQILQAFQIAGMDALFIEALPVEGHVVIGVAQRPLHALKLQRLDLVSRGNLDRIEALAVRGQILHCSLSSANSVPEMVRLIPRNSAILTPSWLVTLMSYMPERPAR